MGTIQEQRPQHPDSHDRKSPSWTLVAVAAIVVLAIVGVVWVVMASNDTDESAVATDLADTWLRGWNESDPDAVGSVFTDDGIAIDPWRGTVSTKESIMADVASRGSAITNAIRLGELTRTGDETFTFVNEFEGGDSRYTAVVEIELDGDLAARIEFLTTENVGPAQGN